MAWSSGRAALESAEVVCGGGAVVIREDGTGEHRGRPGT